MPPNLLTRLLPLLGTGCILFSPPAKVVRYDDPAPRPTATPSSPPAESAPSPTVAPAPLATPRGSADPAAIVSSLRQACDSGQQQGCVGLGALYWNGVGVEQDKEKGLALLQKACDLGEPMGCAMRDRLLKAGDAAGSPAGAPTVDPQAVATIETACSSGNQDACVGLGMLYWRGLGVPADQEKARSLLEHACQSGNANGCTALRLLTSQPAQ